MKQVTFLHFKCTVLLCVILIFSTGCTRQDWLDLVDIGRAWAQANNILDENGSPTGSTLTRVVSSRIGIGEPISTGNETNDALIDAGLVIKDFNKAEKLSEESFNEHDISKIDEAIKIRPQDYSYRNQRGALLFLTTIHQLRQNSIKLMNWPNLWDVMRISEVCNREELHLTTNLNISNFYTMSALYQRNVIKIFLKDTKQNSEK